MKLVLISALIAYVFSYNNDDKIGCKLPPHLLRYLTLRNEAEMLIVDSNYNQALNLYTKALKINSRPFSTDIYNAAVCAALTGNNRLCVNYLIALKKIGLKYELIANNSAFSGFINSEYGQLIKKKYSEQEYIPTINIQLRMVLDSLSDQDQFYRRRPKAYQTYLDSIRRIDTSNVYYFKKLLHSYGFPNEYLIGIDPRSIHSMPYDVLFIHQAAKGIVGQVYDFTPELWDAMCGGSLDPRIGSGFIEHMKSNMELYHSVDVVRMYVFDSTNTYYRKQFNELPKGSIDSAFFVDVTIPDSTESIKINERRSALGLESIDEYKAKVKYFFWDKRFALSKIGGLNMVFVNDARKWGDLKSKWK